MLADDEDDAFFASDALEAAMAAAEQFSSLLQATEQELRDCLREVWGHDEFREGQLAALEAVGRGQDVAIYWATGSGKSLIYQLPALANRRKKATVLVISPLISLMRDQVKGLNMPPGSELLLK
mmetsp:Transcript_992/g.3371  ORF Transcript_992/g.3371 Transcript_992/m.3371 type:complete len:124 (+) Transcript_992:126-497(+)